MTTSVATVSTWERVQLGHAALQWLAERAGIQVLHLKGPALDATLTRGPRLSTDADIWVRPSRIRDFVAALDTYEWSRVTDFGDGSPFEHASTWLHPAWGYVDVHRRFPGMRDGEETFDRLWADHTLTDIAGRACPVPSLTAQRLILMLHAARGDSPRAAGDMDLAWAEADPEMRHEIRELVADLGAEVGFAAAMGHLDAVRDRPEWALWAAFTRHGSRLGEWRGRFVAARGCRAKAGVLVRSLRVNRAHLEMDRGRPLSRGELVGAYVARLRRAAGELASTVRDRAITRRGEQEDRR